MRKMLKELGLFSRGLLGGALALTFGFVAYSFIYSAVLDPHTWVAGWSLRFYVAMVLIFAVGFYVAIRSKLPR